MAFSGPESLVKRIKRFLEGEEFQSELADPTCLVRVATRASGRWVFVADNADEILGIPATDMVGKNLFDFIPSEDTSEIRAMLSEAQDGTCVHWYRTRAGGRQYRWVRTVVVPVEEFVFGCVRLEDDPENWFVHQERLSK